MKLENMINELVGKEMTFIKLEGELDIQDCQSFYNGDNRYYVFENDSISYDINDKSINVNFEYDTDNDFDIFEDEIKITSIEIF